MYLDDRSGMHHFETFDAHSHSSWVIGLVHAYVTLLVTWMGFVHAHASAAYLRITVYESLRSSLRSKTSLLDRRSCPINSATEEVSDSQDNDDERTVVGEQDTIS